MPKTEATSPSTNIDPDSSTENPEEAIQRLDLPAQRIGFFSSPPCRVEMKFIQVGGIWSAYVLAGAGRMPSVVKWLEEYDCNAIHVAPGVSPRVARVEYEKLPEGLARLLDALQVQSISLMPGGVASVLVRDAPERLGAFMDMIEPMEESTSKAAPTGPVTSRLGPGLGVTPRQNEAMALAVALGYYDVPHRVGLREIADQMGLSLGSLSELLRRGEAKVLKHFAASRVKAEWAGVERQIESIRVGADERSRSRESGGN